MGFNVTYDSISSLGFLFFLPSEEVGLEDLIACSLMPLTFFSVFFLDI